MTATVSAYAERDLWASADETTAIWMGHKPHCLETDNLRKYVLTIAQSLPKIADRFDELTTCHELRKIEAFPCVSGLLNVWQELAPRAVQITKDLELLQAPELSITQRLHLATRSVYTFQRFERVFDVPAPPASCAVLTVAHAVFVMEAMAARQMGLQVFEINPTQGLFDGAVPPVTKIKKAERRAPTAKRAARSKKKKRGKKRSDFGPLKPAVTDLRELIGMRSTVPHIQCVIGQTNRQKRLEAQCAALTQVHTLLGEPPLNKERLTKIVRHTLIAAVAHREKPLPPLDATIKQMRAALDDCEAPLKRSVNQLSQKTPHAAAIIDELWSFVIGSFPAYIESYKPVRLAS